MSVLKLSIFLGSIPERTWCAHPGTHFTSTPMGPTLHTLIKVSLDASSIREQLGNISGFSEMSGVGDISSMETDDETERLQ